MPQVPILEGNSVGTAPRRPAYERPLGVSQGEKEASVALLSTANLVDVIDERTAQDDALRAQAAITEEYGKFQAKERVASQGRNAEGHTDRINDWWGKAASDYKEALSPRAQRIVDRQLVRARATSMADASVFQEMQLQKSHAEAYELSTKATVGRAIREASDNYTIAGTAGATQAARLVLTDLKGDTERFAKTQGKPPEWVEAQMLAASTEVHVEVIGQMAEVNAKAASEYFQEHKKQIDPRVADKLSQQLTKAVTADVATAGVDEAWAKFGPKSLNDPVDEIAMSKFLREKFENNADARRLAVAEMGQRREQHNRAQVEFTAANTNSALAVFQTTKSIAQMEKSQEYLALTPKEQIALTTYVTKLQAEKASLAAAYAARDEAAIRRQIAQQTRAYMPFYNAVSNPALLAGMSWQQVLALQTQVGPELVGNLLQRWDSITKSADKLPEAKVDYDSMSAILRELGLDPTARKGEAGAMAGETRRRMELAVDSAQQREKRVLSREEKDDIMRKEAARVVTIEKPWYTGGDDVRPAAVLTPEEVRKVKLPVGAAREDLARRMARIYMQTGDSNFEPTQENLKRFYLRLSESEGGVGSVTAGQIPRKAD